MQMNVEDRHHRHWYCEVAKADTSHEMLQYSKSAACFELGFSN